MACQAQGSQRAWPSWGWPVLLALLTALTAAPRADAQATRTWVSGVGDDANPCSRTAPCKTFAGAIAKTAAGGEIEALDPGEFGAVTITKSISLDGGGGKVAGVIPSGTAAIVVEAGTNDVVNIRNLQLDGSASSGSGGLSGIQLVSGRTLNVQHCAISSFTLAGIDFEPAAGGRLMVDDTTVRDNQGPGIEIGSGSATGLSVATLSRVRAIHNASGVLAREGSRVSVTDSEASGNCLAGFLAAPTTNVPAELAIQRSRSAFNAYGVKADDAFAPGTATVRIANLIATENGVSGTDATGSGSIVSFGNNHIDGNGPGSFLPNVAPGFDAPADLTLPINAPVTTVNVTNVTPTGSGTLEPGQTATLTATSSEPGLVPNPTVSGSAPTFTLTFQPAPNATGVATITVTADDGQCINHLFSGQFLVTVAAPNVAPSFLMGPNEQVPSSSGPATYPSWATGILSGPSTESWQTVAFTVTAADPSLFAVQPAISPTGTLTFTPAPGAVGQTTVTVVLQDDGGTADGGHDTSGVQVFFIAIGKPLEIGVPATSTLGGAALAALLVCLGLLAILKARPGQ
jgi:hypothetical protein